MVRNIETLLQQLADEEEEEAPETGGVVLDEKALEAKYKAGEDIDVDWVIDYYDEGCQGSRHMIWKQSGRRCRRESKSSLTLLCAVCLLEAPCAHRSPS